MSDGMSSKEIELVELERRLAKANQTIYTTASGLNAKRRYLDHVKKQMGKIQKRHDLAIQNSLAIQTRIIELKGQVKQLTMAGSERKLRSGGATTTQSAKASISSPEQAKELLAGFSADQLKGIIEALNA